MFQIDDNGYCDIEQKDWPIGPKKELIFTQNELSKLHRKNVIIDENLKIGEKDAKENSIP